MRKNGGNCCQRKFNQFKNILQHFSVMGVFQKDIKDYVYLCVISIGTLSLFVKSCDFFLPL